MACYTAKDLGRSQAYVYEARDSEQLQRHNELLLSSALENAIAEDRFVLYAQPIASFTEEGLALCHYEILVRMIGQEGELMQPGAFIPAAERFGIMNQLDRYLDGVLNLGGTLDNKLATLEARMADLDNESQSFDDRMNALEDRLRLQFAAADALISQLNSTSTFLEQQLSSLPGFSDDD